MEGRAFVEDGSMDGAEVGSAASVGDGKLVVDCIGGGRTYSNWCFERRR